MRVPGSTPKIIFSLVVMSQINSQSGIKTNFWTGKTLGWLKIAFLALLGLVLWQTFLRKQIQLHQLSDSIQGAIQVSNGGFWLLFFACIFLNWGLEARKWQLLSHKIEKLRFTESYRGVLMGLTIGFISPLNVGEFAGKLLVLQARNRLRSVGAILLGNFIQTIVTLACGGLGLGYLLVTEQLPRLLPFKLLGILLTLFLVLAGWLIYLRQNLLGKFPRWRWSQWALPLLQVVAEYRASDLAHILGIATLRYLTFTLQFVLVFFIFQIPLGFGVCMAIASLIFLGKTMVPAINFISDLGVRELTALYVFGFFPISDSLVTAATFVIWLLNVLFPVLIGACFFFWLKMKPLE
jgi:uncharacterized membrane protein YbhN (UPF0104 family)